MCQYDNDKYAAGNFTSLPPNSIMGFKPGFQEVSMMQVKIKEHVTVTDKLQSLVLYFLLCLIAVAAGVLQMLRKITLSRRSEQKLSLAAVHD